MTRATGFTLLEAVLATALFAALLVVLAALLGSARQAGSAAEGAAVTLQRTLLAADLLRTELPLAGYLGPDAAQLASTDLGGPALVFEARADESDSVTIRYFDDRYLAAPTVRTVTFSAGRDRRGGANLYRREGAGARQPAVEGVVALEILGWVAAGKRVDMRADPLAPLDAVLLELRDVTGGRSRVAVSFAPAVRATRVTR